MAITFLNSTTLTIGTAASTWSIPTHSSVHGGGAFFVGVGPASTSVTVDEVTDNAGNVYAEAVERTQSSRGASAALWYATNISSASTRVSVTLSGNSSGSLGIAQFDGVSTGNALVESTTDANTANSTSHATANLTFSSNGLGVYYARLNASTISPVNLNPDGIGFNGWTSTGDALRQVGAYRINGTASTNNAGGTFRTGSSATSTGGCLHAIAAATFSDTAAPTPRTIRKKGFLVVGVS